MSSRGVACAVAAAALFGVSTPLAKAFLRDVEPLMLAALLYLGAGFGLTVLGLAGRRIRPDEAPLVASDVLPLLAVVVAGGMVAPILMLHGLQRVSGVTGSLLLNLEAPFTIAVAVALFGEHLNMRSAIAALLIVAGAAAVGHEPGVLHADWLGLAGIAGACLVWAFDNNLSQRLAMRDPITLARVKGLGAGTCMLGLALALGQHLPTAPSICATLAVGAVSYGVSIVLDVLALRALGAAREAAFFATAPFAGALAAVPLLGERFGAGELGATFVMATGVAILLTDRHLHLHTHEPLEHEHAHVHDEHHRHDHPTPITQHSHPHRHDVITHAHPHVSDVHHRHRH